MSYSKWVIIAGVFILTVSAILEATESRASPPLPAPGCPKKCGDVAIPYPFGIGDNCSYDHSFNITCNRAFHPTPKPIHGVNMEVLSIALLDGHIRMSAYVARKCYNSSGGKLPYPSSFSASINVSTLTFSNTQNILAATGCDTYAWFIGTRSHNSSYKTGCMTECSSPQDVNNGTCLGTGCCETQIPEGVHFIKITAKSFDNYTDSPKEFTRCSSAFVVAKDSFNFSLANLTMSLDRMPKKLPAVYDWTIGNETCSAAHSNGTCLCCEGYRSKCIDSKLGGYRCSCLPGYSGNPYLPNGCRDINECLSEDANCKKPASCVNTEGSYHCQCPKGFQGNGTALDHCLPIQNNTQVKIILSVGSSIIFLLILGFLVHWHHGKKQMIKMRDAFFRQNGGLILHQRL